MEIFSGNIHNYGVHRYAFKENGKEEGSNSTVKNRLLTLEEYRAHIDGKIGLGIVPIDESGSCKFGVVDVDVYDADLSLYLRAAERTGIPLVPFRSKSGGLHAYLFLRQPAPARVVVELLGDIVKLLGLDLFVKHRLNRIIEIFPKQTKMAPGDVGSWINMPYYNAEDTKQYATVGGKRLSLSEALAYIKDRRKTAEELRGLLDALPYIDGPPCLQTIQLLDAVGKGGGRNMYLFSFAVYLKKKEPEFWEQRLFEVNETLGEPLERDEIEKTIIGSIRKKDYSYKCGEAPCTDFCRKSVCKTREYGVGREGGFFSEVEFGQLVQIKSLEPYYEWQVKLQGSEKYEVLRFRNEADIIGQDAFMRLCVQHLHYLPIKVKPSVWTRTVNQALAEIKIREVDREDDTSGPGMLRALMLEFLTDKAKAGTKDHILSKRVFVDKESKSFLFRASDMSDFVFGTKGFRYSTPGDLHGILHDVGAVPTRIRTESGRQVRVYEIKEDDVARLGLTPTSPFMADFSKKASEDF
jgi:hypothetical protein